jgi:hypothetical protein
MRLEMLAASVPTKASAATYAAQLGFSVSATAPNTEQASAAAVAIN